MVKTGSRYFSLNNSNDWGRGLLSNLIELNDDLHVNKSSMKSELNEYPQNDASANINIGETQQPINKKSFSRGCFYSCAYDSTAEGFVWHRITVDADLPEDTFIVISCYTSDSEMIVYKNKTYKIDELIKDNSIEEGEKLDLLNRLYIDIGQNSKDMLINKKGRYIWIKIEIIAAYNNAPVLKRVRIYLDQVDIIKYLPAIYRKNIDKESFFSRFLAIFQTFIMDMEDEIYSLPKFLSTSNPSKEVIEWLASWVGIDNVGIWKKDDLKELVSECTKDYYSLHGTKEGIRKLVQLYTGESPIIIEHFQVEEQIRKGIDKDLFKDLFNDNPYSFFVLVSEELINTQGKYKTLMSLINDNSPAHTEGILIGIKKGICLGTHNYIGVNTYLGSHDTVAMGENSFINYNNIIGGKEDE